MRVIDLLNKMANKEKVPKFKIDHNEYYVSSDWTIRNKYGKNAEWYIYESWLNEEVEIIEEKPISLKPFKDYLEDTNDLPQIDKDNRIIEYIHQLSLKVNYLLEKESE